MNLYPALKARMGNWTYYILKMKMRELAGEVRFASDVYADRTLEEAIQRTINTGRVKKEIVSFLAGREDRFFASIVVASLGGSPKFYPVQITDNEKFEVFVDAGLDDAYGVLTFTGDQKYYALDGQHRLSAIKTLLDRSDPDSLRAPEGFSEEEISVLMIVRQEQADELFLQSYRRLFSSLNRYARATDKDTNIILDEDDPFAILTRRLITEHEFFRWPGVQLESQRVQTKGKNLKSTDPQFTSLQTLYEMNRTLLTTPRRSHSGWGGHDELIGDLEEFRRFRPDEDYLDELFEELTLYWNGILEAIPNLRKLPTNMRVHDLEAKEPTEEEVTDHLLFWPIGQELFAKIVRRVLNHKLIDPEIPDQNGISSALASLGRVEWRLHQPPWRYFLLTNHPDTKNPWKMRNEDRSSALKISERLITWIIGLDDLTEADISELKLDWQTRLVRSQESQYQDEMWDVFSSARSVAH